MLFKSSMYAIIYSWLITLYHLLCFTRFVCSTHCVSRSVHYVGPPQSSSAYGPPPSAGSGRDYYDDSYGDRQGGSAGGSGPYRPPETGSYSRPPHDMPPPSGGGRDYPSRKSDPYDSYSSAPPAAQSRDSFNGGSSYRSSGHPEPSGPTNRFSSATGPGSNYSSNLPKSEFSSSG